MEACAACEEQKFPFAQLPKDLQTQIFIEAIESIKIDDKLSIFENLRNIFDLIARIEVKSKQKFDEYQKDLIYKKVGKLIKSSCYKYLIDNTFLNAAKIKNIKAKDIAQILLYTGANIETKWFYDARTPLMFASEHGNKELVKFLIDKGANVNAQAEYEGMTPLIMASKNGHLDIVKLLIESGADINKISKTRISAIEVAKFGNHAAIFVFLSENGAELGPLYKEYWLNHFKKELETKSKQFNTRCEN